MYSNKQLQVLVGMYCVDVHTLLTQCTQLIPSSVNDGEELREVPVRSSELRKFEVVYHPTAKTKKGMVWTLGWST